MKNFNILIVGVGGQGTLLASKLMGKIFIERGCDVKVSEVHGMSQRGGSVVTYVSTDGTGRWWKPSPSIKWHSRRESGKTRW